MWEQGRKVANYLLFTGSGLLIGKEIFGNLENCEPKVEIVQYVNSAVDALFMDDLSGKCR